MGTWGIIPCKGISKCKDLDAGVCGRGVVRYEAGEKAKSDISWTEVFAKYCGFYSKCVGKTLEASEEWNNMIRFCF